MSSKYTVAQLEAWLRSDKTINPATKRQIGKGRIYETIERAAQKMLLAKQLGKLTIDSTTSRKTPSPKVTKHIPKVVPPIRKTPSPKVTKHIPKVVPPIVRPVSRRSSSSSHRSSSSHTDTSSRSKSQTRHSSRSSPSSSSLYNGQRSYVFYDDIFKMRFAKMNEGLLPFVGVTLLSSAIDALDFVCQAIAKRIVSLNIYHNNSKYTTRSGYASTCAGITRDWDWTFEKLFDDIKYVKKFQFVTIEHISECAADILAAHNRADTIDKDAFDEIATFIETLIFYVLSFPRYETTITVNHIKQALLHLDPVLFHNLPNLIQHFDLQLDYYKNQLEKKE